MAKMKTNKSIQKRMKLTGRGKLLRRNQLGAGTHRTVKSKSALERHSKTKEVYKSESRKYKKLLGL